MHMQLPIVVLSLLTIVVRMRFRLKPQRIELDDYDQPYAVLPPLSHTLSLLQRTSFQSSTIRSEGAATKPTE